MGNWFILELDTTPPSIQIISPVYTTREIITSIIIKANEQLSLYQEVYIIDSNGDRFDLILDHNGDTLVGEVYLNMVNPGIATIYCRVKDIVYNMSSLISKTLMIFKEHSLKVSLDEIEGKVKTYSYEAYTYSESSSSCPKTIIMPMD